LYNTTTSCVILGANPEKGKGKKYILGLRKLQRPINMAQYDHLRYMVKKREYS
jgi:hypothetical protein